MHKKSASESIDTVDQNQDLFLNNTVTWCDHTNILYILNLKDD